MWSSWPQHALLTHSLLTVQQKRFFFFMIVQLSAPWLSPFNSVSHSCLLEPRAAGKNNLWIVHSDSFHCCSGFWEKKKTEMLVPHLSWLMIIVYAEVFSHSMVQFCWVHYFHVTISETKIDKTVVMVLCGLTPLPSENKGPGPESLFMPWTKVLAMNLPEVELFKEQLKGTWELLHSWVPLMVNQLWMVSHPCSSTLLAALVLTDPSERFWVPWNQRTSPSG